MNNEIELKAWITNTELTEETIKQFATFKGEHVKSDAYWQMEDKPQKLRIRESNNKTFLTYKNKKVEESIEVNEEIELEISDKIAFEAILQDFDFVKILVKKKTARIYEYVQENKDPVKIELCMVEGLGWFLEIEIMLNSPTEAEIKNARSELLSILKQCGLTEFDIEPRFYSELLAE